ncbi:helix-turn-helix domain-containing protein [Massilia sp. PAMC28688]|uniref:GlxA family transcriptional regulator n=1 Tax=Massilia sp. PAMC28688 TaxID=2861283 RepID=UPI001C626CB3|nr:helix-turn-helix domain-containing protein [Massilia sp. PAMC28688]QYF95364.1 helix-turn-helix domain-containing protein [Massilia sp. PAMC28688]
MITVWFMLLPDSLIMDWAGPAEALRIASQIRRLQGQAAPFAMRFCGPQASCATSVGIAVSGLEPLPQQLPEGQHWIVLVGRPGQETLADDNATRELLAWLRRLDLAEGGTELMTICAGSVIAAHAGLLHGRRATTHHHHLDELQQTGQGCMVVRNRVFVQDGPVWSSAGVTTGLDLMLHRIGLACGPALAAEVAQNMVVPLRRGPNDPELSPFLAYRNHIHPALHRVQDAVTQAPQQAWTVPAMAAMAHTSPRHLTRLFLEYAGIAPLEYLRRIRLAVAQTALRSGNNVTQAAATAGFSSDTQLRRAWQHFGLEGTPSGMHS